MKKYFLIVVLIFFVSCNKQTDRNKDNFVIGFSQCTTDDDWRKTMNEEMFREIRLSQTDRFKLIIKDAKGDNQKQIDDIEELVNSGIDLLIVSPNEADPLTKVVNETFDKGIPVITVDRNINSNKFSAYIGADNFVVGKEAGLFAVELLNKKGKIIEISGLKGSTPAMERASGFRDAIQNYPEIQIIKSINGDWLMENSIISTDTLFNNLRDFDLVFAHNDVMAYGAYLSAKKYGIKPFIIGIDGLNNPNAGVQFVLDGYINGTFLYPTGGDKAIQLAMAILNKEPYERYNYLNTIKIDKSNARMTRLQGEQIGDQQSKIDVLDGQLSDMYSVLRTKNTFLLLTSSLVVLVLLIAVLTFYIMINKNRINKELGNKHKIISLQYNTISKQRDDLIRMLKITEETKEKKLQLLTNIYHEFRNVLTIIKPPVKELMDFQHNEIVSKKLSVVNKGAERLLRLSEEILNYTNNNIYNTVLTYTNINLSKFVSNNIDVFKQKIIEKRIKLIQNIQEEIYIDCDVSVIEKVMYNLLSNAIKYSYEGGKIVISLIDKDTNVLITIKNSGKGIPSTDLPHIFTRLYQAKNLNSGLKNEGTGIGLALCKELVQLHGGRINVDSVENEFAEFTVIIPKNHQQLNFEDEALTGSFGISPDKEVNNSAKENTILVVDDNPDILRLIVNIIKNEYNVITAYNGEKGLEQVLNNSPDIIISDILMPIMDGMTMCIKIKNNPLISHIPIILLTAVDSTDSNVKGLEVGADAYITKPFNEELLKMTIRNLIAKRNRYKDIFGFTKFVENFSRTKAKEDQDFIKKCIKYIYENIEDEHFTIDHLSELMNVSRSSLYKKIKRIAGLRAVDFMKAAKLNYAARLLFNSNLTVSEIAWKSGFSDTKYFSKCFSIQFGSNPSVFRNKLINQN